MQLNNNFLSGRIPNSLEDMDSLESLYIGENDLTGDLPRNVCKLRNLDVISLDCGDVLVDMDTPESYRQILERFVKNP